MPAKTERNKSYENMLEQGNRFPSGLGLPLMPGQRVELEEFRRAVSMLNEKLDTVLVLLQEINKHR